MRQEYYWEWPKAHALRTSPGSEAAQGDAGKASKSQTQPVARDLDPDVLTTALRAAHEAGAIAREEFLTAPYTAARRGPGFALQVADKVLEAITREIDSKFPTHTIDIRGGSHAEEGSQEVWLVEPLDGVGNFVHGIPLFSVSIAYRRQGLYQVGVVYDPCSGDLFQALHGRGARLNGRPILVEQVSEGAGAFQQAILGTDWPSDPERRSQNMGVVHLLASSTLTVRVMGSPSLGLCYVASGRIHGYWHMQLRLSQVAAAKVILDEAGGVLTNIHGSSWLHADGAYLATNGVIHGEVLRNIRAVLGATGGPRAGERLREAWEREGEG